MESKMKTHAANSSKLICSNHLIVMYYSRDTIYISVFILLYFIEVIEKLELICFLVSSWIT